MKKIDSGSGLSRRSFLKRVGALAFALPMGAFLAGCDGGSADAPADDAAASGSSAPSDAGSASQGAEAASGNVLVAYYSAQGHTRAVAEVAADALGADLFEIVPVQPYSDDDLNWNDPDSRVSREHEDESLRTVELTQVTPDGWDGYDTVLVGYPIWWGIAAWPTDGFVSGNDFTGKTVIPFCTSASSSIGRSGENLAELAGTGDWQEGMRFAQSVPEADVEEWAESL